MTPQLPLTRVPVFRVRASDLEAFLTQVYRTRDYDFVRDVGCQPGESLEYTVTGVVPLTVGYVSRMKAIREGQLVRNYPQLILETLCVDGFTPAGKYIIDTRPGTPPIDVYRELLRRHGGPDTTPCLQFVEQHKKDRDFQKRVRTMNQLWSEQ